ncbi:serine hydrolase [Flavobacterium cellulosilyticum]|uniref:Beta-lactamase class A catalytic domain-containing protein n=1 Tax=Flavobacterium cellulosilyticum TaxID=2541731 RepID=A0A4R5C555_9FLAO|nr:serine hydrolase [Flavobacterium cellulosilyticum]TDD94861.1 hypothetical protein E0F76_15175 [Flavobacterium cellulosilyticum]
MRDSLKILVIALLFMEIGCSGTKKNILQKALASDNPKIKTVMSNPNEYEVQIIYTQILRDKKDKVSFKDFSYNLNAENYFYPASTVKLPLAILALEKLNTVDNFSINTQYTIDARLDKLRFSEEIAKVFAVSDNEASTNLLEYIGFDYLNESMKEKGLTPFRVSHRLSAPNPTEPISKPITLYLENNTIVNFPAIVNKSIVPLQINHLKKGNGFMKTDQLINEPFDFSNKNYYPLETMHNTMKRIVFPEAFKESERFHLTEKDREFILFSMQNVPKNAGYDPIKYYDGYCKFFMFGDTRENIPTNIKIYNKVGDAYGTITDCAYIVDKENKVEFIVSATLLVNKNKIFNDDTYEYDSIGLPFLAELGRQLYAKNKKKAN